MAATEPVSGLPVSWEQDVIIVRENVSWDEYEALLEKRGDAPMPRMSYCEGKLELVTTSMHHEEMKTRFARLLELWSLLADVPIHGYGNFTVLRKELQRGFEPDECYMRSRVARDGDAPELVIEVVWTSGGLDKLDIFRPFGVAEAWFWEDDGLRIFVLEDTGYVRANASRLLPECDLDLITECMQAPTQHEALRLLQARLTH